MGTIWINDKLENELDQNRAPGQSWTGFLKEKLKENENEA